MNNDLTTVTSYDILGSSGDDEMALSRFHNENSIYLYCVTDSSTANQFLNNNFSQLLPITLYENPNIANDAIKNANISNKVCLRFAINLKQEYYYDQFTMTAAIIKQKTKNTVDEFRQICLYERTYNSKAGVIEYKINNSKVIINVQNI